MGAERVSLNGIAQVLVMEKILEEDKARIIAGECLKSEQSFVEAVVEQGLSDSLQVARLGSKNYGVPLINLDTLDHDAMPFELMDPELCTKHRVLPLYNRGDNVFLAMEDPSQHEIVGQIKFKTGLNVQTIIVESDKLTKTIESVLKERESAALDDFLGDGGLDDLNISIDDSDNIPDDDNALGKDRDDAPIVKFVNKILLDATHRGASDIHFEPYEGSFRVRLRQDGILYEIASPPLNLAPRIAARIKVMSQLDISERRIPQDGRFKMRISKKNSIDFRVSTCPTIGGEKIVMRILDPASATLGIETLGFNPKQQEIFTKTIEEPQGLILVTGPTGSGKTVTLYTALNMLNTTERNISTAEDPVELKVAGINQVNINTKTGLTFAGTLRAFLRQDPDIIMVGEMRDLETAEIGIKAAQTGHLVLSTLHTNSAAETLTRMANMGVPAFNIASSVSMIIAQRLARRLCQHCKKPLELPKEALLKEGFREEEIPSLAIFDANGCELCTQGYKGRVGLYEILYMTPTLRELIMQGASSLALAKQALNEGMETIRISGLNKVREGMTTLAEIYRVTKE